jgi:hypothetical protein
MGFITIGFITFLFLFLGAALILTGIIVLIIWLIIKGRKDEKKRREEMAQLAEKLGLRYLDEKSSNKDVTYHKFNIFNQGHSRQASNIIGGDKNGCYADIFDYVYYITVSTGKTTTTVPHFLSIFILTVPQCFKSLYIRHENFFDKLAGIAGFDDIDFESKEFSRKYYVKSDDRKFAYDIINPQLIDFLLSTAEVPYIEIKEKYLAFIIDKKIKTEAYIDLYNFGMQFYQKTPNYVLEEYA